MGYRYLVTVSVLLRGLVSLEMLTGRHVMSECSQSRAE